MTPSIERPSATPRLTREIYKDILVSEPKPVEASVPLDGDKQKKAFLGGDVRNPHHVYDRYDAIDFESRRNDYDARGAELAVAPDQNPKFIEAYQDLLDVYKGRNHFMELAREYGHATDLQEKAQIGVKYMELNHELYGAPDEQLYRSLLHDKLAAINAKEFTGEAKSLRDDLNELTGFNETEAVVERFRPSQETIEWVGEIVDSLYGGMLAHIPEDKESYTPSELVSLFNEIIEQEFGDASEGWHAELRKAATVNVVATEKTVVVPEKIMDRKREAVRKLVVHELGVHMLRSMMGATSDLGPMANGLSNYYDAEEGLGVVMEQGLTGTFREAGVDHYITAGLAHCDTKDFRDTFEVKWRLAALTTLQSGAELTAEAKEKARSTAYTGTMRIFRGTDDMPWFKDLAYYNGADAMWRHLEEIRGDDLKLTFLLLGKGDASNIEHERLMYETSTVDNIDNI